MNNCSSNDCTKAFLHLVSYFCLLMDDSLNKYIWIKSIHILDSMEVLYRKILRRNIAPYQIELTP